MKTLTNRSFVFNWRRLYRLLELSVLLSLTTLPVACFTNDSQNIGKSSEKSSEVGNSEAEGPKTVAQENLVTTKKATQNGAEADKSDNAAEKGDKKKLKFDSSDPFNAYLWLSKNMKPHTGNAAAIHFAKIDNRKLCTSLEKKKIKWNMRLEALKSNPGGMDLDITLRTFYGEHTFPAKLVVKIPKITPERWMVPLRGGTLLEVSGLISSVDYKWQQYRPKIRYTAMCLQVEIQLSSAAKLRLIKEQTPELDLETVRDRLLANFEKLKATRNAMVLPEQRKDHIYDEIRFRAFFLKNRHRDCAEYGDLILSSAHALFMLSEYATDRKSVVPKQNEFSSYHDRFLEHMRKLEAAVNAKKKSP